MRNPLAIPFDDFAFVVLERRLVGDSTRRAYQTLARHASSILGKIPVGRIRREHVQDTLRGAREAGLSPKTVENLLHLIRLILREAGATGADGLRVRVPDAETRALSALEARAILELLSESPVDRALAVLLGTGLRLAELRGLECRDWLSDRKTLIIRCGKGGRRREVDVPTRLEEIVEAAFRSSEAPFRIEPNRLRRRLRRHCRSAGLPRIRLHDLRHTRATLLLLAGAPALYVSQQLGHHSPAFTLRVYGHLAAATPCQRRTWCNAA